MTSKYFTIESVLGQKKAKKMLRRAIDSGRLGHAYLFRGPAGVGKKTLARAFGNYLNCLAPTSGNDSCENCSSCIKLRSGNHPDLLYIEPDGASIKIKQIRELKQSLAFPPFEAKYRLVLITEVHTMRREAANSLLKILEEPPPGNILVLTGDEASEILPTITSRCQLIPFAPLPPEVVTEVLEQAGTDPAEAITLAAITDNSLGRARVLEERELLATRREIITRLMALQPGRPETPEAVFSLAAQAAATSDQLPELLELLKMWFRDLIMLACQLPERTINHDLLEILESSGGRWPKPALLKRLSLFDKAERELARNCNRTLVCEALFFGLL